MAKFPELKKAIQTQVAGTHYKKYVIQPVEFITKNNIPYIEGNIIKYICRWKDKNGVEDLEFGISGQYWRIRFGQKIELKK